MIQQCRRPWLLHEARVVGLISHPAAWEQLRGNIMIEASVMDRVHEPHSWFAQRLDNPIVAKGLADHEERLVE